MLDALRPVLTEILTILLIAFGSYVVKLMRDKAGIDLDKERRDAFQTALTNAAGLLVAKLGSGALALRLDAQSPGIAAGVDYVRDAVPEAVEHFDLAADAIAEKLVAKIGVIAAPAAAR